MTANLYELFLLSLIFYGNMVGYVKDDAAVVDEMFQTDELSRYLARLNLTPQWKEGVFDRLAAGEVPGAPTTSFPSSSANYK